MNWVTSFLKWAVAGATAGGVIGGIGSAYKLVDDSMKPNERENVMYDHLLLDVPIMASYIAGNKRGDPEEQKHWASFLQDRRKIEIISDTYTQRVVVRFTIAHDALPPQWPDPVCYNEIGPMSEDLASCIRYASFGAPRALELLTSGRLSLVGHGRCSEERIANLEKICPAR
jgi:hypothetical protein